MPVAESEALALIRAATRGRVARRAVLVVVAATLIAGAVAVKVLPGAVTWRLRWLATNHTTSPDPSWDIPVDGSAIRRAAAFVHRGETYAIWYPASEPQYGHDLPAAALLFLTPAKPVANPRQATWILSYNAVTLVPPTVRAGERHELAPGIFLVRTLAR